MEPKEKIGCSRYKKEVEGVRETDKYMEKHDLAKKASQ